MNNRTILGNATMAHVNMNVNIDVKQVVKDIFIEINEAKDDIMKANMIDIRNNNGFEIDFNIIGMMEEELLKIDVLYNKSIYLENNPGEYLLNDSFGTICAMYNGNTYYLIELALKSILTRNSMIFVSETNYMDFTNRLILILIKNILNKYGIDKNLIQLLYSDDFHVLLSNNASINRVLAIGDLEFQNRVKESSSVEVICLGIDRYDIYIEDINNLTDLHIPNLITYITNIYRDQLVYIKFIGLNDYESLYQSIYKNPDMEDNYFKETQTIPEFININTLQDGTPDITYKIIE